MTLAARFSTFGIFLFGFCAPVFATNWYTTIGGLYAKGVVPQSTQMRPNQALFGRCASSNWPSTRTDGAVFFHVDTDPVSGKLFRLIPLFDAREISSFTRAQSAVKTLIARGYLPSGVHVSARDRAWYIEMERPNFFPKAFLRSTTDDQGKTLFVLKATDGNGVRTYCYYFQPLVDDAAVEVK